MTQQKLLLHRNLGMSVSAYGCITVKDATSTLVDRRYATSLRVRKLVADARQGQENSSIDPTADSL
jgi:hypothetical protein